MSEIQSMYDQKEGWGMSVSIDLHGCNSETINSLEKIRDYASSLCNFLGVSPAGEPAIVESGNDDATRGYTMTQFFSAGLLSGHFVANEGSAYLDMFVPRYFDPEATASFAEKFFEAQDAVLHYVVRK